MPTTNSPKSDIVPVRVTPVMRRQIDELVAAGHGSQSDVIRTAVDRMHQQEMMNVNAKQTAEQRQDMIESFLRLCKGQVFDGILARNRMRELWGIDYDWHEFSIALDRMTTYGKATRLAKISAEFTQYMIE